jgi:hypothetical protein
VPAPVWDDLIDRFISAIKNPDPKARFRGSLIDENQFAIDVSEWQLDNMLAEFRARRRPKLACDTVDCPEPDKKAS